MSVQYGLAACFFILPLDATHSASSWRIGKSSNVARYTFEKNSYDGKNKTSGEVIWKIINHQEVIKKCVQLKTAIRKAYLRKENINFGGSEAAGELLVLLCAIWYHLYHLKNVKITHRRVLLWVKLQTFAKSNILPWMFFTFFKLYKWYQSAQSVLISSIRTYSSIKYLEWNNSS